MSFGGFGTNTAGGLFGAKQATGFGALGPPFGANTATTTASTGLFGTISQPAATGLTTTPSFGGYSASNTSGGGITFGAAQPVATSVTTPGTFGSSLSFGSTSGTGFSLGSPAASSTLAFGQTTTAAPTTGGFTFGTSGGSLTFGTNPTTATVPSFGLTATTTSTNAPLAFGTPTTTTGLTFGSPLNKTTGGLTFGATSLTTSAPTFSYCLGTTPPTTSTGLSFGLNSGLTTTLGVPTSVGLGGVDTQAKIGLSGVGPLEQKHVKDQPLPDPILQTFKDVQTFIKTQKNISLEIARGSAKPFLKVSEDALGLESLLSSITNALMRNSTSIEKLKASTSQGLFFADALQRNHENPSALNYEDTGSNEFFVELITGFEATATRLKTQIETAERHYNSITQNSHISPQELATAMRRLHDTLLVMAARVQSLHIATLAVLDTHRRVNPNFHGNSSLAGSSAANAKSRGSLLGPTPFADTSAHMGNLDAINLLTAAAVTSSSGGINPGLTAGGSAVSTGSGWLGGDGSFVNSGLSSLSADNSGFLQLAKPPVGNKRNKR